MPVAFERQVVPLRPDRYLSNLVASRAANIKPHPARFPAALPEFVIGLCTEPDDLVLDPFAGSNTAGWVAQSMGRRWIAFEMEEEYLIGSHFRFETAYERRDDKTMNAPDKTELQPRLFERPTSE